MSSVFCPAITTVLSFVLILASSSASKVFQTAENSSRRVISKKRFGSRVSKLKLTDLIPILFKSGISGAVRTPLVVMLIWFKPSKRLILSKNSMMPRRTKGSPPVILTLSTPISTKTFTTRSISSKVSKCGLGR